MTHVAPDGSGRTTAVPSPGRVLHGLNAARVCRSAGFRPRERSEPARVDRGDAAADPCEDAVVGEDEVRLEVTETEVAVIGADGRRHAVALATLESVVLETNDSGPWGADVWTVLVGPDGACPVPQGARGEEALWPLFRSLPGFDFSAVSEAMCCTENRRFVAWRRS